MNINDFFLLTENSDLLLEERLEERSLTKDIIKDTTSEVKKGASGVDKAGKLLLLSIKKLHTDDEEYMSKGIPQLSKLITRSVIIAGSFYVAGPITGLIAFFTSRALKKKCTESEKNRLYEVYVQKIKFIDEKIERAKEDKNSKEFDQLIRIKSKLKADAQKLKVLKIDDNKEEE